MRKIFLFFILILAFVTFGTQAAKIGDDLLKIGKPGSAADKVMEMGTFQIRKQSGVDAEFSNDSGGLFKKFGTGAGAGGDGGVNYLANPGAEDGLVNWTTTGGTLSQVAYTNGTESNANHFRYISTVAAQFVESDTITIADSNGAGCMFDMKYNQGADSFEYKVLKSPFVDPADIVSTGTVGTLTNFTKAPTQTFDCAPGDLLRARITSTAAATIDLDDFYLGSNKGFINGQAFTEYTANLTIAGVVTNDSRDWLNGDCSIAANIWTCNLNINLTSPMICFASYDNAANPGYKVVWQNTNSDLVFKHTTDAGTVGGVGPSQISCRKTGADEIQTQEAFTPEQADFFIDANIGGANVAPIVDGIPNNAALDMVLRNGSASITCSDGSQGALTCSTGNEQLGIEVNIPRAGKYKACFKSVVSSITGGDAYIRIAHTQNLSDTIISLGNELFGGRNVNTLDVRQDAGGCGIFNISSVGVATFKVYTEINDATTALFLADRGGSTNAANVYWSVEMVDHNVSRPIIQNMVDTSVGSGVRIESCDIGVTGSVSTINNISGLCGSLDNVSWISTGRTTATFSTGNFSSNPTCLCTGSAGHFCNATVSGSNIVDFRTYTDAGALADRNLTFSCTGARQ